MIKFPVRCQMLWVGVALCLLTDGPACCFALSRAQADSDRVIQNIPYRSESEMQDTYAKERCVLDLSIPQGVTDFPTIVWFHSGGLTGGKKEIPEPLRHNGWAIAGVEYRLSPKVKVVDCLDDAAAAVSWVLKNIADRGGSPDQVVVSGHSAGAYLTLMIGLDPKWLQKYGVHPDTLAGLAPFSGHAITHMTARRENGISETQPIVNELAPLFHVRKDAPPILLLSGDREKEMLGRYEENAYLARMLKIVGHPDVTLIEFPGTHHGSMVPPGYPELIKFVKRVIRSE